MKLSNHGSVPVYTIAGVSSARQLPEWLIRKRKRSLKKDADYAHRVELLQDFEFEEASACVRVSDDGQWVLSTDRFLEFHTPGGLHYTTRIPRYGRDLKYNQRAAEALVPAVGVNADGNGEVFRLNLEVGRFMKGYEVDVGGDDMTSLGGGALQGGIYTGSVNCAAIADNSHGLLAFGTSLGTIEYWDPRSRNRVGVLGAPVSSFRPEADSRSEITALDFHQSGLHMAAGNSIGVVRTYDLRSPVPLLEKQQGYDYPIQTLQYLDSPLSSGKILSADKKGIKIWEAESGTYWTGVEPTVDLNHVEYVPDSGMLLTANEGRQQHAFFIPQLGPAPKWCAFLDNLVEEMAEDAADPNAFKSSAPGMGEVYDNYKFLDMKQLRELSLDHLIGTTSLLRPYMHGYFVAQNLYEQARLLTNPDLAEEQRQKSIQEKIDKERESRIRGSKKVTVKVNRKYAESLAAREEANERRKAQRVLRQGGDEAQDQQKPTTNGAATDQLTSKNLVDDRFRNLFENEDFEIDENSREFALHNPSSVQTANGKPAKRGLTAVEEEDIADSRHDSSDESRSDSEAQDVQRQRRKPDELESSKGRIGSTSYKKSGKKSQEERQQGPSMRVSSTTRPKSSLRDSKGKSFGDLASSLPSRERRDAGRGTAVDEKPFGEKEITFAPSKSQKKRPQQQQQSNEDSGRKISRAKERRSASGNVFRRM